MTEPFYDEAFFRSHHAGSLRSARAIVPLFLAKYRPASVVDVGCGSGAWLKAFQEHGIADVWGIDGEHFDDGRSCIPSNLRSRHDLRKPLQLDRTFDLAACLEVAEHLPAEAAGALVESLTALSSVVLFSAAIPFQGGTGHVNEQWPEYWANLFLARQYVPLDFLRPEVWQNADVEWWYAQNLLVYVRLRAVVENETLRREFGMTSLKRLAMVHPKCYLRNHRNRGDAPT